MKPYMKPTLEIIEMRPHERLATTRCFALGTKGYEYEVIDENNNGYTDGWSFLGYLDKHNHYKTKSWKPGTSVAKIFEKMSKLLGF